MDNLFRENTPHPVDLALLSKLGLNPWKANVHEETRIGEVRPYAAEEPEGKQTRIEIYVDCAPAQFYRFVIHRKADSADFDGMERIEVRTGSGSLSMYWPMALAVASNTLVVGVAERLTH